MSWRLFETPIPLAVVTVLYLLQAIAFYRTARPAMCLIFVAYAVANAGFIWAWYAPSK